MLIGDDRIVQMRALVCSEQSAKRRQSDARRSIAECPESDLQTLPEILVPVVMPTTKSTFPESGEGIAVGKNCSLLVGGFRRVQQVALLCSKEKKQAVNEAKELLIVSVRRQHSGLEILPQLVIGRVLQETVADLTQGFRDAVAKIFPCPFASLV